MLIVELTEEPVGVRILASSNMHVSLLSCKLDYTQEISFRESPDAQ